MKEAVEQLLDGDAGRDADGLTVPPMDGFVRATAQYMLQVAIEAEASAFLGRGHYRRGARLRPGWRNGYEPKGVGSGDGGRGTWLGHPFFRATPHDLLRRISTSLPSPADSPSPTTTSTSESLAATSRAGRAVSNPPTTRGADGVDRSMTCSPA